MPSALSVHSYSFEKIRNSNEQDPLSWFGVLVPPALRDAQAIFKTAVEELLPEMAEAALKLECLRSEIEYLRRVLHT